jgi:hypothetical protein
MPAGRFGADCVAKLDEEQLAGNNRIRANNILNLEGSVRSCGVVERRTRG